MRRGDRGPLMAKKTSVGFFTLFVSHGGAGGRRISYRTEMRPGDKM